jgi:hypothetical protein
VLDKFISFCSFSLNRITIYEPFQHFALRKKFWRSLIVNIRRKIFHQLLNHANSFIPPFLKISTGASFILLFLFPCCLSQNSWQANRGR